MAFGQTRLHHLDGLDLELCDFATRGGQFEHLSAQVTLHCPPIDTHHLAVLPTGRDRQSGWSRSDPAIYSWSSSEGRQGLSVVETQRRGHSSKRRRPQQRRGKDSDNESPHAQPPSAQRPKSVPESSSSMVSSRGTSIGAPSVVRG